MIPRCGVSDHGVILALRRFGDDRFFPGKPKWNKNHLRYKFGPKSRPPAGLKEATIKAAVDKAFQSWKNVTNFTFEYVASRTAEAEVEISFYSRDHGDNPPFDGPNGTLAHAFAPRAGLIHYDADEKWSDDPSPMEVDLESLGLHEIGHALGLLHSYYYAAVMYPYFGPGQVKRELQRIEIEAIRDLYNLPSK
ncbi:unnamed protein product [Linum tenue]|nr:unnamed protein product [Linum tenue]